MMWLGLLVASVGLAVAGAAWAGPALELEAKIPLGKVSGRIDHLAIDLDHRRLFVAELGNDSVGVVDLNTRRLVRTLTGLREPQGVGYEPTTDTLYVANAGDGSVDLFQGAALGSAGAIALGDDADNVRVDAGSNRVFIGYGSGALAVVEPSSRKKIGDIALKAHPESFQLDPSRGRIFVNVPDAAEISVVDVASGRQIGGWPTRDARANFPMAFDGEARQVFAAFRRPARLMAFGADDGSVHANLDLCDDADDVFVDARRHRLYVSCGEGVVDIFEQRAGKYLRIGHVATVSGARTSLFVPELDRLFVAVRARFRQPAAIWVFRPIP
jgi:hypothetical protein